MAEDEPKPPTSLIVSVPASLVLIVLFFLPWLTISCDAGEFTKAAQASNMPGMPPMAAMQTMPQITAQVAHASGWELAQGDVSLEPGYQQDNTLASDDGPLKSRPWLYAGLVLPVLALLLGGFGATANANAKTVGTGLLLLGLAGTVTIILAASIDYVDDAMDKFEQQAPQSSCGGPPFGAAMAMQQTRADTKKIIKTKGTPYLWGSLGTYVLLAGCGIAARSEPLGVGMERQTASVPDVVGWRPPETVRAPRDNPLPDFGPDITPSQPAPEPEDAVAPV